MATTRVDPEAPKGPNAEAVEALIAELEEGDEEVRAVDRPLIERARTLAAAVDRDPADSQLSIQYGLAIREIRRDVIDAATESFRQLFDELQRLCKAHGNAMSYCRECVRVMLLEDHGIDLSNGELQRRVHLRGEWINEYDTYDPQPAWMVEELARYER